MPLSVTYRPAAAPLCFSQSILLAVCRQSDPIVSARGLDSCFFSAPVPSILGCLSNLEAWVFARLLLPRSLNRSFPPLYISSRFCLGSWVTHRAAGRSGSPKSTRMAFCCLSTRRIDRRCRRELTGHKRMLCSRAQCGLTRHRAPTRGKKYHGEAVWYHKHGLQASLPSPPNAPS